MLPRQLVHLLTSEHASNIDKSLKSLVVAEWESFFRTHIINESIQGEPSAFLWWRKYFTSTLSSFSRFFMWFSSVNIYIQGFSMFKPTNFGNVCFKETCMLFVFGVQETQLITNCRMLVFKLRGDKVHTRSIVNVVYKPRAVMWERNIYKYTEHC